MPLTYRYKGRYESKANAVLKVFDLWISQLAVSAKSVDVSCQSGESRALRSVIMPRVMHFCACIYNHDCSLQCRLPITHSLGYSQWRLASAFADHASSMHSCTNIVCGLGTIKAKVLVHNIAQQLSG